MVKFFHFFKSKEVAQSTEGELEESYYLNYNIDSPSSKHIKSKMLHIEGWIVPRNTQDILQIEVDINGAKKILDLAKPRPDVANKFNEHKTEDIINCGFSDDIEYVDGELVIRVIVNGTIKDELYRGLVIYSPEDLVDMIRNPDLTDYMAEHENLLENKKMYHYEKNQVESYRRHRDDPKLIAFYLPQYHPFAENDKAWGKGFTEWTNVTAGKPRFVGHQQPILPGGLGFYDLRVDDSIREQIELAKQHGIYGFCFYYYWFSGKKIMDTPLNSFLRHKEWDFNFTICWANENWTKRWDGREDDIIIGQEYLKDDPLKFIKDVEDILNDDRYINIDGKPVLVVYRASELKRPKEYAAVWREYFKQTHNKELYLVSSMGFEIGDPGDYGFDCGLDFAPQTTFFKKDAFIDNAFPYMNQKLKLIDKRFNGAVTHYRDLALNKKINSYFDFPVIKSIPPSWDNDARKKGTGYVMYGSNPDLYGEWLNNVLDEERRMGAKSPIVFINAWNEWAEGAVLEPSQHFGYANLNRTTQILARHSLDPGNSDRFPVYGNYKEQAHTQATFIHIYEEVDLKSVHDLLDGVEKTSDLYITSILKYKEMLGALKERYANCYTSVVPSRGGDILPFIITARRLNLGRYRQVVKLNLRDAVNIISIDNKGPATLDDINGSVRLLAPSTQLGKIQWCDVEDFEPTA